MVKWFNEASLPCTFYVSDTRFAQNLNEHLHTRIVAATHPHTHT